MSRLMIAALVIGSLAACGGKNTVVSCNDATKYQSAVEGKRVEIPEDLDPLDEFKEMPIPKAETEPRAENAGCLERPPSIKTGN